MRLFHPDWCMVSNLKCSIPKSPAGQKRLVSKISEGFEFTLAKWHNNCRGDEVNSMLVVIRTKDFQRLTTLVSIIVLKHDASCPTPLPRKVSQIQSIMGIDSGILAEGSLYDSDIKNWNRIILIRFKRLSKIVKNLGLLFKKMEKSFRMQ